MLNEEKALPVMKAAWDVGINTFDTANMYSNGESQRLIAKFMREVYSQSHAFCGRVLI